MKVQQKDMIRKQLIALSRKPERVLQALLYDNVDKQEVIDKVLKSLDRTPVADELVDISTLDDLVGQKLFIRTVTYHMTGKVTKRMGTFIQMEKAAWIADSGKFSEAIKNGTLSEVEYVGTMWVNLSSVVDFFPWKHDLPTTTK